MHRPATLCRSQQDVYNENEANDQRAIVAAGALTTSADPQRDRAIDRRMNSIAKMLTLSVVYASNIGGTATLTGTPTNLIIATQANRSASYKYK